MYHISNITTLTHIWMCKNSHYFHKSRFYNLLLQIYFTKQNLKYSNPFKFELESNTNSYTQLTVSWLHCCVSPGLVFECGKSSHYNTNGHKTKSQPGHWLPRQWLHVPFFFKLKLKCPRFHLSLDYFTAFSKQMISLETFYTIHMSTMTDGERRFM